MGKKNDTIFFIPDISGFTDFVNETEISHSSHIISELLEGIMSKNTLKLDLVEVEGDALFYFKKGSLPDLGEVLDQARDMFLHFHHQLLLYKHRRICDCGACSSSVNLGLKFIIHIGESEMVSLGKGKAKPFGKDVIFAHKLLKNQYSGREYILTTENTGTDSDPEWFSSLDKQTLSFEDGQEVVFNDLTKLHNEIPPLPQAPVYEKAHDPIVSEAEIDAPIEILYELISNLDQQMLWKKKVKKLEYKENHVNRMGEKHLCYVDGKVLEIETVAADFGEGSRVFGEKTNDIPFLKSITTYFILNPNGMGGTNLRIEVHLEAKSLIGKLMYPIIRRTIQRITKESLESIQSVGVSEMYPIA
ncbi:MAG: DUF2652 domain-containing protein [Cyclobacteriaceae bacterium]